MKRVLCSLLGRSLLLALAGGGVCGVALAAPSPARLVGGGAQCGPAKARTLASSTEARVYTLGGIVYGCAGEGQFRLGSVRRKCDPCFGRVVAAGTVAAYALRTIGYDTVSSSVIVRRLTDGKRLSSHQALSFSGETRQLVSSLVAKPDGHVAWIGVSTFIVGNSQLRIEVHRGRTILDSGRAIHRHSLKLRGSLLTWKHGSETRHARLR